MGMTREDVLRELELLPVWRLRVPAISTVEVVQVNTEVQKNVDVIVAEITEKLLSVPELVAETSYYVVISDDKKWAFVLPQALTGKAQILFNNILLALQLDKTHIEAFTKVSNLADVKVIVAMGEATSQQLLKASESFEQLRGKIHVFENVPLVVTYHPDELLQHLANKANMWDDLCMAKPLAST